LPAYIALFAALGGTSYAAITIPNNSVGNKQLKKDAVDSRKTKNGTIQVIDFKTGQAPVAPKGEKGDIGDQGPQGGLGERGEKGNRGDRGDSGTSAQVVPLNSGTAAVQNTPNGPPTTVVREASFTTTAPKTLVQVDGFIAVTADCPCFLGDIGVFVDGVGVPGTKEKTWSGFSFGSPSPFGPLFLRLAAEGALADVGPGAHKIQFGYSGSASISENGGSAEVLVIAQ
jgi:hypothetical protein